ncbi:MAG: ADP-ribosylation factor-like protein [Candidatus Odinarchaeota archaeon]
MLESKKLVFVGPPGTGKTTIKKVLFEKANPANLLENPLKPSRGVCSEIYTLFQSNLGVFDLAGQENTIWLSNRSKDIFNESNIIICIFDVKTTLESIINFLIKIYEIKKNLNLKSCKIVTFIHKIDLVSLAYIERKIEVIKSFIIKQHPRGREFEIYKTSIKESFFYNIFHILSSLLFSMYPKKLLSLKKSDLNYLVNEINIISNMRYLSNYSIQEFFNLFDFGLKEIKNYLKNLEIMNFITIHGDFKIISLTERGNYFKQGLLNSSSNEKSFETFRLLIFLYENN